jgi:hypothetical protein
MTPPRCIAIDHARCPRRACRRAGDIFVCSHHARLITMALIDDRLAPQTRRMLAYARWNFVAEGRRLIDRLRHRRAA